MNNQFDHLPFGKLKKLSELLSFEDWSVLDHYRSPDGSDFLSYWIPDKDTFYRRLLWQVSRETLVAYLRGSLTLRNLIMGDDENASRYVVNVTPKGEFTDGVVVTAGKLSPCDKPESDSVYDYAIPKVYQAEMG